MAVKEVAAQFQVSDNEVYLAKSRIMPQFEKEVRILSGNTDENKKKPPAWQKTAWPQVLC